MTKFQCVKLILVEGRPFQTQTTSVRCAGELSALAEEDWQTEWLT
ncbi:hypothetical protein [Acetobacter malorum]|nr:hypothetical protein [Acetobacter malorum]